MTKPLIALTMLVPLALAGCATNPSSIQPAYVSSVPYQSMSCPQLKAEAARVSAAAAAATGAQKSQADRDAIAVGVSLVLFWPAVFLVGGDKASAAEVSRLKGEMQAIQEVNAARNCGIVFQPS